MAERSANRPALCLQQTELFSVYSAAPPTRIGYASQYDNRLATEMSSCLKQTANTAANEVHAGALPTLPIRDLLCESGKKEFLRLIHKHSFMILTDIGSKAENFYSSCASHLESFFQKTAQKEKSSCTSSKIYENERDVAMWFCGYEQSDVRECFRVPGGWTNMMPDAENSLIDKWPSESFQIAYRKLIRFLQTICDVALGCVMRTHTDKPIPKAKSTIFDYSVAYAFMYGTGTLEGKGKGKFAIDEHCDPSLFVVEPIANVAGLEIFCPVLGRWVGVEAMGRPGKDIAIFCGKALQRVTENRVKATLHRVRQPARPGRLCVIFEQKYSEYCLS